MHVVEAPRIRRLCADLLRLPAAVRSIPGDVFKFFAAGERCRAAGAAGIFPFGLGRESHATADERVYLLYEMLAVVPRNAVLGVSLAGELRALLLHHAKPLLLRDLVFAEPESAAQRDLVLRLVAEAPLFVWIAAHHELARFAPNHLHRRSAREFDGLCVAKLRAFVAKGGSC